MIIENVTIIKKAICYYTLFINIIWLFLIIILNTLMNQMRHIWQQNNNTKESKVTETAKKTEKELVRLNYKEAIIKGFTLKGIQQYIATKTKIWIEWSCLEYLRKQRSRKTGNGITIWPRTILRMSGHIRKCIDEIEHLKKDMWNIIMDSKVDMNNRIQATKELHSLSKTSVLLIKDLPFVTNLSKFYDEDILNSSYNNIIQSKNAYSNSNSHEVARIACKEQNLTAKI